MSQIIDEAVREAERTLSDPTLTPQGASIALIRKTMAQLTFPTPEHSEGAAQLVKRFAGEVAEACSKFEYFAIPKAFGQFVRHAHDLTVPPSPTPPEEIVRGWLGELRQAGASGGDVVEALIAKVRKGERIVRVDKAGVHFASGAVTSFEELRKSRQPGWMEEAKRRQPPNPTAG